MTIYPTLDEVVQTHRRLVEQFGGAEGIRDLGSLEAALLRPQIGYYIDVIEEGAALWESLSQNHPFVDGNKHVAVTVVVAFLRVNGYRLEFDTEVPLPFSLTCTKQETFGNRSSIRGCART